MSASARHPNLELTSRKFVFFGGRSLDELAFRSYELFLLAEFAEKHTLQGSVGRKDDLKWNLDCDSFLAVLSVELGMHNYIAISRHPLWLTLTSSQNTAGTKSTTPDRQDYHHMIKGVAKPGKTTTARDAYLD